MRAAAIALAMLGCASAPALCQQFTEEQIKSDCTYDALYYCGAPVASYIANPSAANRKAILACMIRNRSSLQAKCARHLH